MGKTLGLIETIKKYDNLLIRRMDKLNFKNMTNEEIHNIWNDVEEYVRLKNSCDNDKAYELLGIEHKVVDKCMGRDVVEWDFEGMNYEFVKDYLRNLQQQN